jgi:hypothetical protein
MNPFRFTAPWLCAVLLAAVAASAEAKRGAAKVVEPVIIDSVQYSAPADPDLMGFVVATDISSGKELWRQRIYRVPIKPTLERDVQWVFITSLSRHDHSLLISNERGEHFTLDLTTRKVVRAK